MFSLYKKSENLMCLVFDSFIEKIWSVSDKPTENRMNRKLLTMLSVCLLLILASLAVAEESVSSLSTLCDAQECACLNFSR